MNKKLIASIAIASVVVVALVASALFFMRFGEAMAFAVTNRSQVLDEKSQWTQYVNNYGKTAEAPKAN